SATPSAITLTGASVGGGATTGAWSIVSGGGTLSSTAQTATPATVTYTPAANFTGTVTLRLTTNAVESCAAATADRTINVSAASTANAGGSNTVCQSATPSAITLTGASFGGGATTGAWSIVSGGGTLSSTAQTATPATVTYIPAANFTGTVTLRLTTNAVAPCAAATADRTINVSPNPILVITNPPSVCSPLTVNLTVASVTAGSTLQGGALSYWTNAAATVALATPSAVTVSGTYYIKVLTTSGCMDIKPVVVVIDSCAKALCTYTQGAYGTIGGMSCAPDNGIFSNYSTEAIIAKGLASYPGGTMTIGMSPNFVWMTTPQDVDDIIRLLPGGGGGSYALSGNYSVSDPSFPASYLTKKGTLNNTLLAQTITLGLNLGINGALGDFVLQDGMLVTAAAEGGCGSDIPKERKCNYDINGNLTSVTNDYQYYSIDASVVAAIEGDKTIQGLFALANKALGGGNTNGVSLTSIADVVDKINNAFDGCRIFMGYDVPKCPETNGAFSLTERTTEIASFDAYPVPFKDQLTIRYNFDYVSDVKIDVLNSQGVSVFSKMDSNSYLNKEVTLNLNSHVDRSEVYFVKVTTNRGSSVKKVISSK
ncbi:T9SS type A sorting domain-containing protein, partial [Flavobacterium sp. RSP29]|uniref:T9SS type A sorting domain-containing protein n=1 Tax=Flavobacterium sp. RSP29 TaxID=3401731 RepID=UPI003AAC0D98